MQANQFGMNLAIIAVVFAAVFGCSAQYRHHGHVPDQTALQTLTIGVDTRASVDEALGSPAMAGLRQAAPYYYVRSRVRHLTYNAPQIIEREVVAITFGDDDVIKDIARYNLKDGRVVTLSRRVTEIGDVTSGVVSQLFQNVGNITADQLLPE